MWRKISQHPPVRVAMPGACGRRRCRSAEVFGVQQGFRLNSCSHIASLRQALQPFLRQLPLFTAENQQQRPRRPHLQWKGLVKKWGSTAMKFTKVTLHFIRKPLGRPDDFFGIFFFGFIRLFVDRDGKVWERSIDTACHAHQGQETPIGGRLHYVTAKHIKTYQIFLRSTQGIPNYEPAQN